MKRLSSLKVLIIGLGQIGGSVGMDLVDRGIVGEVIGYDIDQSVVNKARRRKIINRGVGSIQNGLAEADLIIMAAPIRTIMKLIPTVCTKKKSEAAVLDLAGTKAEILKTVKRVMPGGNYVSGHPIAGNEKIGLAGVEKGKFKNAAFILVLHSRVQKSWKARITQLVRRLGARPIMMKAEEHDRLIALTSHLPYALALGIMNLAAKKGMKNKYCLDLVGGSFKGATRVTQSPADLTLDMFLTNKSNVTAAIDGMIKELTQLRRLIDEKKENQLRNKILNAQTIRKKL